MKTCHVITREADNINNTDAFPESIVSQLWLRLKWRP